MPRLKYNNSYDDLRRLMAIAGVPGHWVENGSLKQFRRDGGAVLNFWPPTHTVTIQGRQDRAEALLSAILSVGSDDFREVLSTYPMNDGRTSMTPEYQKPIRPEWYR